MVKRFEQDEIVFVCESFVDAEMLISALSTIVPFYTEKDGSIYVIRNIRNPRIEIRVNADIERLYSANGGEEDD